ncbi:MAG: hypothetical protein IJS09_04520 [Treponema sp.]|nr:hypothetical protein [Treponema sp.]
MGPLQVRVAGKSQWYDVTNFASLAALRQAKRNQATVLIRPTQFGYENLTRTQHMGIGSKVEFRDEGQTDDFETQHVQAIQSTGMTFTI